MAVEVLCLCARAHFLSECRSSLRHRDSYVTVIRYDVTTLLQVLVDMDAVLTGVESGLVSGQTVVVVDNGEEGERN